MRFKGFSFVLFVALFIPLHTQAAIEFSADTVDSHPQYGDHKGHIYVGRDRMRTDYEMNGEQIIQIIDLARQQAIVIDPARKSYMRRQAGKAGMGAPPAPAGDMNPCANMQNLSCKDAGTEMVNGRRTHKWVITGAGQSGSMVFWLDEQRKIPVRQEMPDGSLMEMREVGNEVVNGRKTEKWELTSHLANGQSQTSTQWYDPELNFNIREEQPGGFTRNLVNIRPGRQPDSLFSVPAGFTEQSMPPETDQ